jgi:hypothetical protein
MGYPYREHDLPGYDHLAIIEVEPESARHEIKTCNEPVF